MLKPEITSMIHDEEEKFISARRDMVMNQLAKRDITDLAVLETMGKVPRHLFIDPSLERSAYEDHPLPIGDGQTISQPYMVALMTQALGLAGKEKVLEIGTGSGYQTVILALLADRVFSIERIQNLAWNAERLLHRLELFNVLIKAGDGTHGWPEEAPFDAIIVTAGSPKVPQPLMDQLAINGRLVIPVGDEYIQTLYRFTKVLGGRIREENLGRCRFVKLVGHHGWEIEK